MAWLFQEVWWRMKGSGGVSVRCQERLEQINACFQQAGDDANELLRRLSALDGIGLIVATGLIYAAARDTLVPFDEFTVGWALRLRILPDNKISFNGNYTAYSQMVVEYIRRSRVLQSVLEFVREAGRQGIAVAPE